MYIGIGPEEGRRVYEKDAFGYACQEILYGTPEEQKVFMDLVKDCSDIKEFAKEVVDWFYSGNWYHNGSDEKETVYIIRFSDKRMRAFHGTYLQAVESAREEATEQGIGFVVN